jgi:hypothetical protein
MRELVTAFLVLSLAVGAASASVTVGSAAGAWSNPVGGVNINYDALGGLPYGNGTEDRVWWGVPNPGTQQSGLGFIGSTPPQQTYDLGDGTVFEVGQLTHYNNQLDSGTALTQVDLTISAAFLDPAGVNGAWTFTLSVDETRNIGGPVDDIITFPDAYDTDELVIGDTLYTMELLGFGNSYDALMPQFTSPEDGANQTLLWGKISASPAVPAPGTLLLVGLGTALVGALRRRRAF